MGTCKHCNNNAGFGFNVCKECNLKYYVKKISTEAAPQDKQKIVIEQYKGSQSSAIRQFEKEAKVLAKEGYLPTSQSWQSGSYGFGDFFIALLLCFILIGFLVFLYMLIVKPNGTLTVTYELKNEEIIELIDEVGKLCPQCAEKVKEAAKICRFCGHSFLPSTNSN